MKPAIITETCARNGHRMVRVSSSPTPNTYTETYECAWMPGHNIETNHRAAVTRFCLHMRATNSTDPSYAWWDDAVWTGGTLNADGLMVWTVADDVIARAVEQARNDENP